jgi:hypothetical protein
MADLRQRIKVEATLKDGVSRGLEGIRKSSARSLGDKGGGLAMHAGTAKLAMAGLAAGVVATGVAILRLTTDVARQNDELAKLSTRLGASTEALSQLKFVAERSGVTFQTFTMGLQRMTRRVAEAAIGTGEARGALKELGIEASVLARMKPEDQFKRIAEAMIEVKGSSDRVRLAMKLFDSEGVALLQTMDAGAAGIQRLMDKADKLGLTVTKEMARQSEAYQDAVTNLTGAFDGLAQKLAKDVIPLLTEVLEGISEALETDTSGGHRGGRVRGGRGGRSTARAGAGFEIGTADDLGPGARGRRRRKRLGDLQAAADAEAKAIREALAPKRPSIPAKFRQRLGDDPNLEAGAGPLNFGLFDPQASDIPSLDWMGLSTVTSGAIKAAEVAGKGFRLSFERGLNDTSGPGAAGSENILNALAFGRSTGTQDVIDRQADKTGDEAARRTLQGWRTRTAKDGELDVVLPFSNLATSAGESFVENLDTALTLGLADFMLTGDLKKSTKTFGATLAAGMVVDAAATLSEGITTKLGEGFKEGGFAREGLIDAGQDIGRGLKTGANLALETLQVPDSFAARFGPEGSVGAGVVTNLGAALTGAVTGFGLGAMLGDEITAHATAIGGALGGAFAGPTGAIIGQIVGALSSKIPVVGEVMADIFGITDRKTEAGIRDLGTDIQAFGGVTGFFKRIGGLEGIEGERLSTIEKTEGGAAFARAIRLSVGTTGGQAKDVIEVLRAVGRSRRAGSERGARVGFATQDLVSSQSEITNVLRSLGLDPDLINFSVRQTFIKDPTGERRGGMGQAQGPGGEGREKDIVEEPPPPSSKPVGSLRRLSISEGRDAFLSGGARGGRFLDWQNSLDAPFGSPKGNNILNLISSAGQNQDARRYLDQFYDIVAARGYHGTVRRPTTILAGEAGPERIDISPAGTGYLGGASNGQQTVVHFNVNISALDPRGVRDLMEGEVGDMLLERIRASSERGETVIYSSGVTTPPSV